MIETNLFKSKFIPAIKSSDRLMIVLHGRGDSIKPFKSFNEELNILDMNYLLLNAPRKFMSGYSWYGEPPYQSEGVQKIRAKLLQLIDDLEQQGWKPENIFIFGFSQGCLVSADLALNYPKKLGGVIGISGYFHFFPRWKKRLTKKNLKTPFIFTHGHKDDILPIEDTKYGVRKLKDAGFEVSWIEMNKKHTFEEEEMPLIKKWINQKVKYRAGVRPRA
jgi:phospholipase/carboxylesterase